MAEIKVGSQVWDLHQLYVGDHDPQIDKDLEQIKNGYLAFANKWKNRSDYLSDPKVLLKALRELDALDDTNKGYSSPSFYFSLRRSQNDKDPYIKEKANYLTRVFTDLSNDLLFFDNKLSKVSPKMQKTLLAYKGLYPYKHHLETLFAAGKYILSEKEEKLVNLLVKPAYYDWTSLTSEKLSAESALVLTESGKKEEKTLSELPALLQSPDEKVRKSAYTTRIKLVGKHVDTATAELNAILNYKKVQNDLRGAIRPDETRLVSDDMDTEVVDTMLSAVRENFGQVHKYYELKARILGKKQLKSYDSAAPIGNFKHKISYQQGINLVGSVLNKLDPEFFTIFKKLVEEGRIDAKPRKGKRGGAFCSHYGVAEPVYIFTNYTNDIDSVLTIAHEVGHAINFELMKRELPANYGTSTAVAEVASTFMEDFVFEELLATLPDKARTPLLARKLEDTLGTIHTQVAFYTFEQNLHAAYAEKAYLAQADISELYFKQMVEKNGKFIDNDQAFSCMWAAVPHFRYFFYVYSYASGLLISMALQEKYRLDHAFMAKIKEFLSTGSSKSPKEVFRELGIDLTDKNFWSVGMKKIDSLLLQLEESI